MLGGFIGMYYLDEFGQLPRRSGIHHECLVGSMVGFGSIVLGPDAVQWTAVSHIAIGWVTSPLISGITAYILFYTIQQSIFVQQDILEKAKFYVPIYLLLVGSILSFINRV